MLVILTLIEHNNWQSNENLLYVHSHVIPRMIRCVMLLECLLRKLATYEFKIWISTILKEHQGMLCIICESSKIKWKQKTNVWSKHRQFAKTVKIQNYLSFSEVTFFIFNLLQYFHNFFEQGKVVINYVKVLNQLTDSKVESFIKFVFFNEIFLYQYQRGGKANECQEYTIYF